MKNSISWFEIPAKDFDRAKKFYETVMAIEVSVIPSRPGMVMKYGMLPFDREGGGIGGGLVEGPGYEPSDKGALVYLSGGEDLSVPLSKVEAAGGRVVVPKMAIGPNGFMAQFIDTEGNKMAFHSKK